MPIHRAGVPLAGTASERLLLRGLHMNLLHLKVLHDVCMLLSSRDLGREVGDCAGLRSPASCFEGLCFHCCTTSLRRDVWIHRLHERKSEAVEEQAKLEGIPSEVVADLE
jgi:hypothetical protein